MVPSLVRTIVPYIVGYIVYIVGVLLLRFFGVEIDLSGFADSLEQILVIGLSAIYYAAARWLERNRNSKWGWLLGVNKQPVYGTETHTITPGTQAPTTLEADPSFDVIGGAPGL